MRYAFISDIHANLQAWRAVHLDLRNSRIDYTLCLGDVIGYGPSPAEVLNEVHAHVDAFVLGNHDAAVSGRMDDSSFNPHAREMIRWTASKLNRKASTFISSFPLSILGNRFHCVHGEFSQPASFNYVLTPEDTVPSWQATDATLLFAGHTHEPSLFLIGPSGKPHQTVPQDFELESDKRYFINVGSVGCSRDGDPRASYCIYDTEAKAVFWRRIPFDLDSYRTTIIQSGLDPSQCHLLKTDPLHAPLPVRACQDFTPPTDPEKIAHPAVATQDLTALKRSLRYWQKLFIVSTLLIMCGLLVLIQVWPGKSNARSGQHRKVLGAPPVILNTATLTTRTNLLCQPSQSNPPNQAIPGWQVIMTDHPRQKVSIIPLKRSHFAIQLESSALGSDLSLSAPIIPVTPGQSWNMSGLFEKHTNFSGSIAMAVILTGKNEKGTYTNQNFAIKEPFLVRADGWMKVRQAFTIPAGGKTIQVQIRGRFHGTIRLKNPTLEFCPVPAP